jgi:hypothetical protein
MNEVIMSVEKTNNRESIEEVYDCLDELTRRKIHLSSPEELDQLESEIIGYTNRLAALLIEQKIQESLDSPEQATLEKDVVRNWPGRMKSDGFETVNVQTRLGEKIQLRTRYYRRSCDRRKRKKHKGAIALTKIDTPLLT